MTNLFINPPKIFCFNECLWFLDRGFDDCLYNISDHTIYKAMLIDGEPVLIQICYADNKIQITSLNKTLTHNNKQYVAAYVKEWLDLDTDLSEFYQMAKQNELLSPLISCYHGLTMIGINDLFEALCWAIMGQQINLNFAYKTKRAFVEKYGESIHFNGKQFYLFPTPEKVSKCTVESLKQLQFSANKAKYIINLAGLFNNEEISKRQLSHLKYPDSIRNTLISIKGIGSWTAEYAMMKCFKIKSAFPIQDVGLQNAIKQQLRLQEKPSLEEIKHLSKPWSGWESYATLYLWRSLSSPSNTV